MFRESGTSIKARSWVSAPAAQFFSPAVYTQVAKVFWLSRNPLWKDRRPQNLSKRINNFFFSLWLRGLPVYVYMYFNLRLWCFNIFNTMVTIIAYEITRTYEKDNGSLLGTWLEFFMFTPWEYWQGSWSAPWPGLTSPSATSCPAPSRRASNIPNSSSTSRAPHTLSARPQ